MKIFDGKPRKCSYSWASVSLVPFNNDIGIFGSVIIDASHVTMLFGVLKGNKVSVTGLGGGGGGGVGGEGGGDASEGAGATNSGTETGTEEAASATEMEGRG